LAPTPQQTNLRKEMGLGDLVLAQVLCVVGSGWGGRGCKLGRTHVLFWLVAMLTFYSPLAAVVIYLNRLMPLEGGFYRWAKEGFGQIGGFLAAWNLWVYAVVVTGGIIFAVPTNLFYIVHYLEGSLRRCGCYRLRAPAAKSGPFQTRTAPTPMIIEGSIPA
jgi:amino acid transporter